MDTTIIMISYLPKSEIFSKIGNVVVAFITLSKVCPYNL
jgi:hypothetical protein